MRQAITILFLTLLTTGATFAQFKAHSILADGTIYKLQVDKSGVYKITFNFIGNNGIDPSLVKPNFVKVYGQRGGMLPQSNAAERVDDFEELPIQVEGGEDGTFDPGDYLLFYAEGPHAYTFNETNKRFEHELNLYDDYNYYYLKLDASEEGLRIAEQASNTAAGTVITSFDDFTYVEPEINSVLESGRKWYGKEYKFTLEEEFALALEGIVPTSDISVALAVMTSSTEESSFSVELNNQSLGQINSGITPISTYGIQGVESTEEFTINANGLNTDAGLNVKLTYNQPNINAKGYLDYILINASRTLQLYNDQTKFRSIESMGNAVSAFQIAQATATTQVWEITDPLNYINQEIQINGSTASFKIETSGQLKEFVVFDRDQVSTPLTIEAISNQDLHGLEVPNLLIITPSIFLTEAERLAEFRRQFDGLSVQVVELPQIYQEFSSGRQDITAIRDFVRMLYLNSTDEAHTLRYVLLFGDASYDYKDRIANNTNQIPVYESHNSLHPVQTYSSDDYFGFLEEFEGEWAESGSTLNSHTLDIGIGRLPVNTRAEATILVDKLIYYSSQSSALGDWRKKIAFVADDGDFNIHQRDADRLAVVVDDTYKNYNADRIFVDAYPQVSIGITKRSEEARAAVRDAGQDGVLIMNFTGHGAESGWTSENLLDHPLINEWTNLDNMPLFVTATCQFGRYDNPAVESGAEVAIRSKNGGAIGLLTTTRPVLSFSNFKVNKAFFESVFELVDGEKPRLGDVIRLTKNNSINGVNNRNFSLLGDPSMRLAYPQDEAVVTSIKRENGDESNVLRALDRITVQGEIRANGTLASTFNGILNATVFEKPSTVTTLGDEGPNTKMTFENQESKIYEGTASIENGQFEFSFVVPMDINYELGASKISLYAKHHTEIWDATGFSDIEVGGSNNEASIDNTPPEVDVFLEDESFVSGGIVPRQPLVLANIADISGINLTGIGLGHQIKIVIDNQDEFTYNANSGFAYDLGSASAGKLRFQIPDQLEPGDHVLKLTVFDAYNNGVSVEVDFRVTPEVIITELLNYPNPFNESTTFSFTHNREGDELKVSIQIYSTLGELMAVIDEDIVNSSSTVNTITWNGVGDSGLKLSSGIYIYRLVIQSQQDDQIGVKAGRLYLEK
ncbi:MAG: type IX secretion system sortase PorU [Flammeovirgaceae bacterium]